MRKTENGLVIIKEAESTVEGKKVMLTRKTNKAGEIRHGVVLESRRGTHFRVGTFTSITPAFLCYKALAKG